MRNEAFRHALHALSHPFTLGAVLTLLLNNHLFRHVAPSWWTGKLGDVSWLIFSPLMLAAILAWLLPSRLPKHTDIVGYSSFLLIGLGFALTNTIPLFHQTFISFLRLICGWQPMVVRDPTDLLTLPAMLVGWYIWRQSGKACVSFAARGWFVLSIAVLSTTASEPGESDYGVLCMVEEESLVAALSYNDTFSSKDGGLTWVRVPRDSYDYYQFVCTEQERRYMGGVNQWELIDPNDSNIIYRFEQAEGVEKSSDGARTWLTELKLPSWTQAQQRYYARFNSQGPPAHHTRGPFDAVVHSATGNLVVSMGYEGVLVKTPREAWQWTNVGPYQHVEAKDLNFAKRLLTHEVQVGLLYAALAVCTITRYTGRQLKHRGRGSRIGWLVLTGGAWLFWLGAVFSLDFDPRQYPLEGLGTTLFELASGGFALLMILFMLISWRRSSFEQTRPALKRAAITTLVGFVFFLLPYVLWTQGDVPYYSSAITFAVMVASAITFGGYLWIKTMLSTRSNSTTRRDTPPPS